MPKVKLPEETKTKSVKLSPKELEIVDFMTDRVQTLKDARKAKLGYSQRSVEDIWKEADNEYQPHELGIGKRVRFEQDETTGLASRLIKLGRDQGWQSNVASPDFYVKVNTALSIIIDENPEAVFIPSGSRYEKNTKLAYENWKQSWEVAGAKRELKKVIFNMAKYGVGYMKTYPKLIEMQKSVRTEYYPSDPEKDKYEEKRLVKFNDLCRESLSPWNVWMSPNSRVGDPLSIDDCYQEIDFSLEKFKRIFKDYKNHVMVKEGMRVQPEKVEGEDDSAKKDDITVGFYENQELDLYVIWVPSASVPLYFSPLPNDDGMLSITSSPWSFRDDKSIYGIGIYEIIRNDSILFDRLKNMTIDQLTLSIYKMFFYKGTDVLGENGQLIITPGKGEQVVDPQAVKFLEIPGPGAESWKGLQYLQEQKDNVSGVTQQLTSKFQGKTLGQDLEAKSAALERLKTPFDFILDLLQQEAYLTISWQKQILSTPEILEYNDPTLVKGALEEMGLSPEHIQSYLEAAQSENPSDLSFSMKDGEEEKRYLNVYKERSYGLEQDDKGELIESKESRFYRFGIDLPTHRLDWKGIIRIKPQSVLAPSKDLTKRMKLDMFNLIVPAIEKMLLAPQHIPVLLKPITEIVKVYDEDVDDWVDEEHLMQMYETAMQPKEAAQEPPRPTISIKFETLMPEVQKQILSQYLGIEMQEPLFIDSSNPTNGMITMPKEMVARGAEMNEMSQVGKSGLLKPLVPRHSIGQSQTLGGGVKGLRL